MLSKASKYSINAVLYLAVASSEENKIGIKEVAEAIQAPAAFLAKQLQILARNGIVTSMKGPSGGFFMTGDNMALKMIKIVDCIDGLSRFNACVLGLKECNSLKPCPIHHVMDPFRNELLRDMSRTSIGEYADKVIKKETFLVD